MINLKSAIILFAGMYLITVFLFFYETGDITKALAFGIFAAVLKTIWSKAHHRFFVAKNEECPKGEEEQLIAALYYAMSKRKR